MNQQRITKDCLNCGQTKYSFMEGICTTHGNSIYSVKYILDHKTHVKLNNLREMKIEIDLNTDYTKHSTILKQLEGGKCNIITNNK